MYTVSLLHFCGPCGAIQLEKIAKKYDFFLLLVVSANYTPLWILSFKGVRGKMAMLRFYRVPILFCIDRRALCIYDVQNVCIHDKKCICICICIYDVQNVCIYDK